ncbi:DNA gyrase inhibitor YacG [Methyloparacoccus murrellii]
MSIIVSCPTCRQPVCWSPAAPFRPFCSERCRLIDLGEWAAGSYAIPAEPASQDDGALPLPPARPETDA